MPDRGRLVTRPVEENAKLLGVYSTQARAQERIANSTLVPGFQDHPRGFTIAEYVIDRDEWAEGFIEDAGSDG